MLNIVGYIVLFAVVSGCTVFSVQPQVPSNDEVTQWVLNSLRKREARILSVKGLFQASVSGSSVLPISQNLDGVLFYERPYLVQLRGFARIGGTIFEFQSDGDSYQLSIPSAGKAVQGQVAALDESQEVSRIVELSLRTMDAILGKIEGEDNNQILIFQDENRFRLDIQNMIQPGGDGSNQSMTRVWVNRETLDVVQVEYLVGEDEIAMVVECSDFRVVESKKPSTNSPIRLPFHIRAEDLRSLGGSMTLTFKELAANSEFAPS